MSVPVLAIACMLVSALGHAVMNTFNKSADDKVLFRGVFLAIGAACALPIVFFLPTPTPEVWRHLHISLLIHGLYTWFLLSALQRGDMGLVYPIMRGFAPVLAALVALVFLHESLPLPAVLLLLGACATLIAFAWPAKGAVLNKSAILYAMLTACMIAGYSVNDAAGVRAMGNPFTYIAWFFVAVSLPIALVCFYLRRKVLRTEVPKIIVTAAFVSLTGFVSYSLALVAFFLAPVALMSSMRETSVVFGAVLAAVVLKEPFGAKRAVLAVLLVTCLVGLQLVA